MTLIIYPPGTPLPDGHPFKGNRIIIGQRPPPGWKPKGTDMKKTHYEIITGLTTRAECRQVAKNAKASGRFNHLLPWLLDQEVRIECAKHRVVTPVDQACVRAIVMREAIDADLKGVEWYDAGYTWGMLSEYSPRLAVERLVTIRPNRDGWKLLVENGLTHYSYESFVVHHADWFSKEAVAKSAERLAAVQETS